ncbi:pectin lyase fold/virulence factor [Suillus spraguei]|nr:pectin lyase fold/virulence factor [Suillus spraguei]
MFPLLALCLLVVGISAVAASSRSNSCIGTISSLNDVSSAIQCTTVNINAFTVPAGQQFKLQLLDGTTVNVLGEVQFGNASWGGPLFVVIGNDITFNGNNQKWDGGGPFYWDTQGMSGGIGKPTPMMGISISGTLNDVYVVNSPAHAIGIGNPGPLTVSGVTVNNSQGNYPNAQSNNQPAGRNTDGLNVHGSNVIIQNRFDDCVSILNGTNITLADNYCEFGHGISIGSISSNRFVSDVEISGNTVVNSAYSFRIKTDTSATNSIVQQVTYAANTAINCTYYGVLITQLSLQYGTPGNGVTISDINFNSGTTSLTANSGAYMVSVNCGVGSCTASGGKVGSIINNDVITGFTQ